jgi:hypothetical protein
VVDAQVHGNENDLGHFTGGFIQLEGRIRRIFPTSSSSQGTLYDMSVSISFDIEPMGEEVPYCMPIVVNEFRDIPTIYCLMLRPVDQQSSSYTRIGLLTIPMPHGELILPDRLQWIVDFALMDQPGGDLTVVTIL